MRDTQRERDEFKATQKFTGCVISTFMLIGFIAVGVITWVIAHRSEEPQKRDFAPKEGVNPMFIKNYER